MLTTSLRIVTTDKQTLFHFVHYFYVMLSKRDEELFQQDNSRRRCHFFKSFFVTKLLNEGNANPDLDGKYDYKNVKRWSKRVPGKDIFKLDKIFFPINEGRMHWICAVAFMKEKRIQMYDSMGSDGMHYLENLFQYIKDEHKAKKGCDLPNADEWKLVPCERDTPRQRNGKIMVAECECLIFTVVITLNPLSALLPQGMTVASSLACSLISCQRTVHWYSRRSISISVGRELSCP